VLLGWTTRVIGGFDGAHPGSEGVQEAGEGVGEIAEAFGLTVVEVRWALVYETSARAA
jgi:hypothetical protein